MDISNIIIEDKRMKQRDIEILSQKSSSHQQTLSKEAAETNEMKSAIAQLSAQRDTHLNTKESLLQQIAETQKQIDTKLAAQRAHAQHIDAQSRFNVPELEFWSSTLCLDIDGVGVNDRIKFVFTHIDDRDWTREAFFELDASRREYDIPYCKPKLEKEQVERVLEGLNETRQLGPMLKAMRALFVEAMKG
jgi:kinetochore protein Spc25